ncbi:pimeloyl-ACP methyl ester carboxylesterase [Kineothrix alysoides]|uniref:Pimeloyl-ACP methyl ester carboxylesterase n=1 Tax=Kineothrix alysoides TaxID=1469948 RepID=A0A4R1QS88_9FIRM|nr:alpha/beta hydrolase [Kineothrix alysoides]TCL56317.1 pimeloyl-ACP methyl ester carboxylesterase [Kineothrix alysoides]
MWKKIKKALLLIFCCLIIFFILAAIYHFIMLKVEKIKIKSIGTSVAVDGYNMNVYLEGKKTNTDATIVLLSGSGVASPIYDYKILYSKLTDEYQVAVVEKFGYGYSDVSRLPRDVKTLVEEDRKALKGAGIEAPYVLMPHSMSALEAIYWADTYPEEVERIIGLDMAVPDSYVKSNMAGITFMKTMTYFGMHRIPVFCYVNQDGLSDGEYEQNKLLVYRNSLNADVYEECKMVLNNAKTVGELPVPDVPILMFTTNLAQASGYEGWVNAQEDFAEHAKDCTQIKLDCGHNLHYYKSDYIVEEIKKFMKD